MLPEIRHAERKCSAGEEEARSAKHSTGVAEQADVTQRDLEQLISHAQEERTAVVLAQADQHQSDAED